MNEIFHQNFNFPPKTEFGNYDGIVIKSFFQKAEMLGLTFEFTVVSRDSTAEIENLFQNSLEKFEHFDIILPGQEWNENCKIEENVQENGPKTVFTWLVKSSVQILIETEDKCRGNRGKYYFNACTKIRPPKCFLCSASFISF